MKIYLAFKCEGYQVAGYFYFYPADPGDYWTPPFPAEIEAVNEELVKVVDADGATVSLSELQRESNHDLIWCLYEAAREAANTEIGVQATVYSPTAPRARTYTI